MSTSKNIKFVGVDLAAVLPQTNKSWIQQPHLLRLNSLILVVMLSSVAMGFDGAMMNGLLSLKTWNDYFGTPRASILGLMNAVLSLGVLLSSFPAGYISERFGRTISIKIGAIVLILGAVLQGASQNVAMFIVSRFLLGVGIEFGTVASPVLVTELAYPTHRGKLTALYNCFFYLGAVVSSWITFGTFNLTDSTWSWRIPSLLQSFFPLIQFTFIWFVPESPRWLASKDRIDEARAIFTRYYVAGDDNHPLVDFEIAELRHYVQDELETHKIRWSSLWETKADRKRLLIIIMVPIISQWSGNGLVSYYLSLVLDSVGITSSFTQTLINGILQIFNGFAAVFGSLLVDRLGRRVLWLWSCVGMLVSFIIWTACSAVHSANGNSAAGIMVIAFVFIFFFHYDIAVTPFTWSYPAEILPFHTRSRGMSLVNFINGVCLLFNSFVNPIAIESIEWKYYIIYVVLLSTFVLVVYFFFPETRGRSLEEMGELFDDGQRAWKSAKKEAGPSMHSLKDNEVIVELREDIAV